MLTGTVATVKSLDQFTLPFESRLRALTWYVVLADNPIIVAVCDVVSVVLSGDCDPYDVVRPYSSCESASTFVGQLNVTLDDVAVTKLRSPTSSAGNAGGGLHALLAASHV
jgi:hypothetical protein